MSEWRTCLIAQVIDVHRTGWLGVWDALVAAITRNPRLTSPRRIEVHYRVKGDAEAFLSGSSATVVKKQ